MQNPTRRNKNIGTSKQGYGCDNKLKIAAPWNDYRLYYEKLSSPVEIRKEINGQEFVFLIEKTRKNSFHACTPEDIERILQNINKSNLSGLKFIIFRQPKRKEEILKPVWGRLIYSFEYKREYEPAIIFEAIDFDKKFKRSRKLNPDDQDELNRLKEDGHNIIETKREYVFDYELDNVRRTQLYRTLIHEIGHYKHYLDIVERGKGEFEDNRDYYWTISSNEKEKFAHNFADRMKSELEEKGIIPFDRIMNSNLDVDDFEKQTLPNNA